MDVILVGPSRAGETIVAESKVEVSFDGGAFTEVDDGVVRLPAGPRPITFTLRVSGKDVFPVTASLTYKGGGELSIDSGDVEAFPPPRAVLLGKHAAVALLVILSILKDVTAKVIGQDGVKGPTLWGGSDRRAGFPLPGDFSSITGRPGRNFVADPPIDGSGHLAFEERDDVDPDAEHVVFEVKVPKAPKLISVTWPSSVARADTAAAADMLVYFHPNVGQNFQFGYYQGAYPYSWDYMYFGIVTYVWYAGDPLRLVNGWKGIPFQIAAAGRKVVTVLPVNGLNVELGVFLDATWMQLVLQEIASLMMRRKGVFRSETLGRVGLAAFSAGVPNLTAFLGGKNKSSKFNTSILKEVYAFEPPADGVDPWCNAAKQWLAEDPDSDKRARCYAVAAHPDGFKALLGRSVTEHAPHFATSDDGRRTTAVIPISTCISFPQTPPADSFQFSHQFVSDLFLTHAVRISGFAK